MNQQQTNGVRRKRRDGLTLIEILLVLAIVIMVAALALPAMNGTFDAQRLTRAADMVRSDWSRARVEAIRSGQEWVFCYIPGTGSYGISPYSPYQEPTLPQGVTPDQDARSNFDYGGGQLPRGVIFNQSDVMADTRSQALDEEGGGNPGANSAETILFYPDGTAQQAALKLSNEREWFVQINLRALTGTATVSEVAALQDQANR